MSVDVWVLGGTGRTGSAIARDLASHGARVVLLGRDQARLAAVGHSIDARHLVVAGIDEMAAAIRRQRPNVVVNTVGSFLATAGAIIDACLEAGSDYVDLANDMAAVPAVLARHPDAVAAGHTLVTGAGFGGAATESLVVRICEGRPPATRVRVDMIPSMAATDGVLGEALAFTLVEGLPGAPGGRRFQGRRVSGGRLTPVAIGARPMRLTTPDGDEVVSGLMPLGELVAAQLASGAQDVEAASSEAPTGAVVRALMPVALNMLYVGALRRMLARRLAAIRTIARPRPRAHSWAHARIEWADGTVREGWLALGDASDATAAFASEVALRLGQGGHRPGAFTAARLFGSSLAESRGGQYHVQDVPA